MSCRVGPATTAIERRQATGATHGDQSRRDVPPMTRRAPAAAMGFVDQGLSSASNVMMLFAVARVTTVAEFGVIAVVVMVLNSVMAISRGSFGTPILLAGGRGLVDQRLELSRAQVGGIALGLLAALVMILVGAISGAVSGAICLAIAAPIALAQDAQRFGALARQDQIGAVLWDGVWAVGSLALLGATWVDRALLSGTDILAWWAALAATSYVGLILRSRSRPMVKGWSKWWLAHRGHRLRYGLEGAIGSLSSLVVVSAAAALIGASAAAALRGAGTLMGPMSILMAAIPLSVVPDVARAGYTSEQTWRRLRTVAAAMSVIALAVGSVGLWLPERVGALLLGDSWLVVSPLLPISGLEYAALAWVSIMYTTLRASGRSSALLRARLVHAATSLVLATGTAWWVGTALGVAIALAAAAAVAGAAIRIALPVRGESNPQARVP